MQQNTEKQRDLFMSRNTAFLPDLEPGVANLVIEDLSTLALSKPRFIPLVIKSNGGISDDGFMLAQFIEHELDIPVHARVFAYCHSAATYPLLCCTERIGYEYANFVLHHQTTGIQTDYGNDYDKVVKGWQEENHRLHQQQISFYSKKLGLNRNRTEKLLQEGSESTNNKIDAERALDLGILTTVVKHKKGSPL